MGLKKGKAFRKQLQNMILEAKELLIKPKKNPNLIPLKKFIEL